MRTAATIFGSIIGLVACAQCAHDPVITPNSLILCPGDSAVLSTQAGDSYQWYRNQNPIPGATGQTLLVTGSADAGSDFEVHVVLDSCLEFSPMVSVGGYAFLQPQVYWYGDAQFSDSLGIHFCDGSAVQLVLQPPYDAEIMWYNDGVAIGGAVDDTLMATLSGSYTVTAGVSVCPGQLSDPSYPFDAVFEPLQQPTIIWLDTLLCADPPGLSYQWSINGIPVFNGSDQCIAATFIGGSYTVDVDYGSPCQETSAPYVLVAVPEVLRDGPLRVWPNPTQGVLNISSGAKEPLGSWSLVDFMGREILHGTMPAISTASVDVGGLVRGTYLLRISGHDPVTVVLL